MSQLDTQFSKRKIKSPTDPRAAETLPSNFHAWSYTELAEAIKALPAYSHRPDRTLHYTVGDEEFSLRVRVGGPSIFDYEMQKRFRRAAKVVVEGNTDTRGDIRTQSLWWKGNHTRSCESARVVFRFGKPIKAQIYSETHTRDDGAPKILENIDVRTGRITSELGIPEILGLIRSQQNYLQRDRIIRFQVDATPYEVRLDSNNRVGGRFDSLLRAVLGTKRVSFDWHGKSSGLFNALGFEKTASYNSGLGFPDRDMRLTFDRKRLVTLEVLSPTFASREGQPLREETLDYATRRRTTDLSISQLATLVAQFTASRKRGKKIKLCIGPRCVDLILTCGQENRFEELLARELKQARQVMVKGELCNHGVLQVLGLKWYGQTRRAGKEVEVTFSNGKPANVRVFSSRHFHDSSNQNPKCEEIINCKHQTLKTELSLAELVSEFNREVQGGSNHGEHIKLSFDQQSFTVPAFSGRGNRFVKLIAEELQNHPQVVLEGLTSPSGLLQRFGLRWSNKNWNHPCRVRVEFRRGQVHAVRMAKD